MKKSIFFICTICLILVSKAQEEDPESYLVETFEESASFPGGIVAFYKFLHKNMKYPKDAIEKGIEGRVYVEFIVEEDGSITNKKVVHGIGGGCDKEALRLFDRMPKWIPGKSNGVPVRQRMIHNIFFKLSDRQKKKIKKGN